MTITKKPSRGKSSAPKPSAAAHPEEFIQAADHPVTPAAIVEDAPSPELVAPVSAPVSAQATEADTVKKDKDKAKDKKKKDKKKDKKKEAVLIRFENSQLEKIDGRAEALGLSRAAFVRMAVAQTLAK